MGLIKFSLSHSFSVKPLSDPGDTLPEFDFQVSPKRKKIDYRKKKKKKTFNWVKGLEVFVDVTYNLVSLHPKVLKYIKPSVSGPYRF